MPAQLYVLPARSMILGIPSRTTSWSLQHEAGVDTMTIKDLGRWEILEMVQRYTRSVTFEDSMRHYKAPLSQNQVVRKVLICRTGSIQLRLTRYGAQPSRLGRGQGHSKKSEQHHRLERRQS